MEEYTPNEMTQWLKNCWSAIEMSKKFVRDSAELSRAKCFVQNSEVSAGEIFNASYSDHKPVSQYTKRSLLIPKRSRLYRLKELDLWDSAKANFAFLRKGLGRV